MVLKRNIGGSGPIFLDGQTYLPLFIKTLNNVNETRWHPTDPNLMIYVANSAAGYWNVRTGETTIAMSFNGYKNCMFGPYEGNTSNDGNFAAFYATRVSDNKPVAFACDLKNRRKYPDIDLSGIEVDWVSISPKANYIVLNGSITGGDQTQVYELHGNKIGLLWSEYGRPSHYDLTIDTNGDEVAVGVSQSNPNTGKVIKRRLRDGSVTELTKAGFLSHISTRNLKRPGWAYVTYGHYEPNWPPYWSEVVAVKLDGTRVERIAHLHSTYFGNESEPHAVPSRDGERVVFASDWGEGSNPIQSYVADFRGRCNEPTSNVS